MLFALGLGTRVAVGGLTDDVEVLVEVNVDLAAVGSGHFDLVGILTPPYTPRWNGKVERFQQTMEREWAKGLRYRNSTARNRALPHWLRHYNERRPPQPRRTTTDQPRSQPPRAGQLGHAPIVAPTGPVIARTKRRP